MEKAIVFYIYHAIKILNVFYCIHFVSSIRPKLTHLILEKKFNEEIRTIKSKTFINDELKYYTMEEAKQLNG
jgi:hypothetical protein